MVIGKKFNELTKEEYFFFIDHHKQYDDFNTLGLHRSIIEHDKLTIDEKIQIRDHAHKFFQKTFDFLQLKDPKVFIEVSNLGLQLTKADEEKMWSDVIANQQKILSDKRIKHRNFGIYSKHNCGQDDCFWNGLMVRQGSWLKESNMHFDIDKNKYQQKMKSKRRKAERKSAKRIIDNEFELK